MRHHLCLVCLLGRREGGAEEHRCSKSIMVDFVH